SSFAPASDISLWISSANGTSGWGSPFSIPSFHLLIRNPGSDPAGATPVVTPMPPDAYTSHQPYSAPALSHAKTSSFGSESVRGVLGLSFFGGGAGPSFLGGSTGASVVGVSPGF